jgi:hypothetical protein
VELPLRHTIVECICSGIGPAFRMVFSFQNISGALGPLPQYQSYKDLSTNIGRAYVSFVRERDPNAGKAKAGGLPNWPKYSLGAPTNMVLNSNGSFVEADMWRKEGMAFINSIPRELLAQLSTQDPQVNLGEYPKYAVVLRSLHLVAVSDI